MGAVDVGVGHDHDPLVAQLLDAAAFARAAAERLDQVGDLAVAADLVRGGGCDVQDLAADRKDRLGLAVARLLGEPPAESPRRMNNSVPAGSSLAQSVSLPGRRSLRELVAVLRFTSRSACASAARPSDRG
jgi:hypothetical protein